MKAVKGYTKEYYKTECIKEGGEPFEFSSFREAAGYLANMIYGGSCETGNRK